jgi:hypothetical protein
MIVRFVIGLTALAFFGAGTRAWAQQEEDEILDEVEVQLAPKQAQVIAMADENFDQWIFGGNNAQARRPRLESHLQLQLGELDRACGLSAAQKQKLLLAGRGDIKRLFDRVDEKRKKFQLVKNDQNKIGEMYQEIQPLQAAVQSGLFGDGSLFGKTVRTTLMPEQAANYQAMIGDRRRFRYQAKVELAVSMWDNAVGLTAAQRRKLADLVLAETKPPTRFGQYDYYVVLYQAAKIPEAKISAILGEAQLRALKKQFQQAQGMEQFLERAELLPEDEERADARP